MCAELPDASEGTLCAITETAATTARCQPEPLPFSSPYVDRITFVPKEGLLRHHEHPVYQLGSVGEKFYGTVIIGVDSGDTTIRYQTKHGKPAHIRGQGLDSCQTADQST